MQKEIPPQIKQLINSLDYAKKIMAIGDSLSLNIDQTGELGSVTTSVLIGELAPEKYISRLKERLEIGDETAMKIQDEVKTKVFDGMKSQIREMTESADAAQTRMINAIENPTPANNVGSPSVNLLSPSEEYPLVVPGQSAHITEPTPLPTVGPVAPGAPAPAAKSINLLDQYMSAPTIAQTDSVQKMQIPKPPRSSDPYREPIE